MSRQIIFILAMASLVLLSPAPTGAWRLENGQLQTMHLPVAFQVRPAGLEADFDGDGRTEHLALSMGQLQIETAGQIRWQSPAAWQVEQAGVADLNHDGLPEAVLLVWRPFQPWPVDEWLPTGGRIKEHHNAAGLACHLILIGWQRGQFRERWAGSALADPIKHFAVAALTGDGKEFLVTLEADYRDLPPTPARRLKVWEWNGFGFSLVAASAGRFTQLSIGRQTAGPDFILAP